MLRYPHCNRRAHFGFALTIFALVAAVSPVRAAVHLRDTAGPGDLRLGYAISALNDVNADGRSEFLIGAPGDNRPGSEAGRVFFWLGGTEVSEAATRIYDGTAGDWFGYDVAAIGDVNDDGVEDWAAGAPYSNAGATESGRIYIFFGTNDLPASGLASLRADLVINGANAGDHFGHAIASAGDFNGDGLDDLIVGAPHSNLRAAAAGAAYILYGSNSGPSTDLADATVLTGQGAGDHFGWSVTGAGNFLGYTEQSVAVGAPLNNTHGGLNAGAVYVFEGALHGAAPDTSIDFASGVSHDSKANSEYGYGVSNAGRWNADGYDDLVIGAPFCAAGATESGRIEIIYGGTSPDSQGDKFVNGESAYDHFGFAVARGYDLAGSSAEDILIGAPNHSDGASDSGRAYIMEGGSSATSAGNLTILAQDPLNPDNPADDLYGFDVASAGDFDGDGIWDLAVSAPMANMPNNSVAGYCRIQDSSGLTVPNFIHRWQATWAAAGSIDLLLKVAVDPAAVQWIDVKRQMFQPSGAFLSQTTIFSGPLGVPAGGLYYDQAGYHFLDEGNDYNLNLVAGINYSLVFSLTNGSSLVLDDLAGPGAEPVMLQPASMGSPWPNPCNPGMTLEFMAPRGDNIVCRVVDIRGHQVRILFNGSATGGTQSVFWDGNTANGRSSASGVYMVQLLCQNNVLSRRVVLAR